MPYYSLSEEQRARYQDFKSFVSQHVEPWALQWDRKEALPDSIIHRIASEGYLEAICPVAFGGKGWDAVTYGLLNEAFGKGSSALTAFFTVQNMVLSTLMRWGSKSQNEKWIPELKSGRKLASFCLTEPQGGSDIQAITCEFLKQQGGSYLVNGTKKWITFGARSDLFLVFGKAGNQSMCCILEKGAPGFTITPIKDMLGFRGCHMGQLDFDNVVVLPENMVGKPGFALNYIAPLGLHYGRISTTFNALGIIRGCLEEASAWLVTRRSGHRSIREYGQVQEMHAEIGMSYDMCWHICLEAALAYDENQSNAMEKIIAAKYIASRQAVEVSNKTVQLLGAHGCHGEYSLVPQYFRDAKITEIIEGTTQVLQGVISDMYLKRFRTQNLPVNQTKQYELQN